MARAFVGGREYSAAGWGSYEISRRGASAEAPSARYPGLEAVGPEDVVYSILGSRRRPTPLDRAAGNLRTQLSALEAELRDPATWGSAASVPPLTAARLAALEADPPRGVEELLSLAAAADATAVAVGARPAGLRGLEAPPEAAPGPAAPSGDDEGILRLEAAAEPRVEALEALEGAVAGALDAAATAVGQFLRRRRQPAF